MLSKQNFPATVFESYRPAVLKRYKSIGWVIEYFSLHPQKKEMRRVQIKMNRIAARFSRVSDFRVYANGAVSQINVRLAGGWSPFMENDNSRYYTSINDIASLYIREKSRELRPDTMRCYSSFVNMFLKWCDKEIPGAYASLFNRVLAIRYMDYVYDRNVSARTYNNTLKMARAFFSWAREKCYVKENPFELMRTKREGEKRRTLVPAETRGMISEYLEGRGEAGMLCVCRLVFNSLIRPKEIREIRLRDISLEGRYITIPAGSAKNHHERYAAITDEVCGYIRGLHVERYRGEYYLFGEDFMPSRRQIGGARFRKEWDRIRKALRLPQTMQLYSLRDTGINNLLKAGVDPLTVMQHADHHDLAMTTRYANHADPNLIRTIRENAPEF